MEKYIFTLFSLLISINLFAQKRLIQGRVITANGVAMQGVTVKVKGSSLATQTDLQGNFKINVSSGNVLVLSYLDQQTEYKIGDGNNFSIVFNESSKQLTEVVVTALGQNTSKAKVGYSTSTFKSEAINRTAAVGVLDGLAGKIAGAEISNTGGPGSSTKVILRGYGVLLDGSNQPLYVIDGVPLADVRLGSSDIGLTSQNDFGNSAADINPNDIESVTVLKGTAASSLYGSAARNGAIMITTKRGKTGKIHVDFAGSANLSKVGKLPFTEREFGQGWNGTFVLGENGSWGPRLDGKDRAWGAIVDNSQLIKPFSFIDDNIRNFYTNGYELNNNIAISGGLQNSSFYFSYGNVESDGVIPSSTDLLKRNTFALRTNSKFNNFTINSSFNYVNKKVNQPTTGQGGSDGSTIFQDILQIPVDIPITDFRDYKNKFFNVNNYFTPYAENPYYGIYENRSTQSTDRFFGNLDMTYKFTHSISAQLRVGADIENARTFTYKATNDPAPGSWNKGLNTEGANRAKDVGSVYEYNNYNGNINADFILKYNNDFGSDFNLNFIAGSNFYQADSKATSAGITDLLIPGFYNLSNSTKPPKTTDNRYRQRLFGIYSQATLGFKNQLFLTLNARNDWSSTLPINNNHFFYPGGNLSWVASQTFNLEGTPISFLKFRAGYGKTGTDAPVYDLYPVLVAGSIALSSQASIDFPFNGVSSFRIQNQIANAGLKPILTTETEAGMELKLFKDRIGLDVALYDKRTNGQIFNVPISPGSGYTSLVQNLGLVSNKGIEVSFDAKPVDKKNLTWSFNYNFSKNWNKVEDLTGGLNKISIFEIIGGPEEDAVPGKTVTGIYAQVPQYTPDGKVIVNPQTGFPLVATDKGYYGDAENDYRMGLTNTIRFKEWQINFSLDYRKGGVFYSKTADQLLFTGNNFQTTYNDRRPFIVPNSVVQTSVDAEGKPVYGENTTAINENNLQDFFSTNVNPAFAYRNAILDRSFLKLRDISFSYSLPANMASAIKATDLTVTIYGRNFLLWTPNTNTSIDPEASNFGNDLSSQFGEFETAPTSKQFGIAIKAGF